MPSSKDYLQYISEQLSKLNEITFEQMMGEYIIYYKGKIVGGLYDNRLLVKPTDAAKDYIKNVSYELPYEGAKEMILVEETDSKDFLCGLFDAMYPTLPEPKKKRTGI